MTQEPHCPACGDVIWYCAGHGEIADPGGRAILVAHDNGDHSRCEPMGCEVAEEALDREMIRLRDEYAEDLRERELDRAAGF